MARKNWVDGMDLSVETEVDLPRWLRQRGPCVLVIDPGDSTVTGCQHQEWLVSDPEESMARETDLNRPPISNALLAIASGPIHCAVSDIRVREQRSCKHCSRELWVLDSAVHN